MRPDDGQLADLREQLSGSFEALARDLLGEPKSRNARQLRYSGGLIVDIAGRRRGWWTDFSGDSKAQDAIALVMRERHCGFAEACAWARTWLGSPQPEHGKARPAIDREPSKTNGSNGKSHTHGSAHVNGKIPSSGGRKFVTAYRYEDVNGGLMYEVHRFDPKYFPQRRPHIDGGWIWGLSADEYAQRGKDWYRVNEDTPANAKRQHFPECPRVLYRLPEVLAAVAAGHPIYITEGEKDADNLRALGVAATCNSGGAGNWLPEYAQHLTGAHILILPDNDDKGRKHGEVVKTALTGVAASIQVIDLPGLGEKGDVSDWLAAGGTLDDLRKLESTEEEDPNKPTIAQYFSAEAWAEREFPEPVRMLGDVVTNTSRVFLVGSTGLGTILFS